MKLNFEYGHGLMAANLPDNTDIFIPDETVKDPALHSGGSTDGSDGCVHSQPDRHAAAIGTGASRLDSHDCRTGYRQGRQSTDIAP